ncbi:MAG: rRNA maturation RNase YbeY [Anaerolineales bacterium]
MIQIQNDSNLHRDINEKLLKSAIQTTLSEFKQTEVDLTLRLTNDAEMLPLNRTFRGIDLTTDVLSFNQDFTDPETGRFYLGDIIISIERALEQAPKQDHTLNEECTYLAIHGILHLLGFDHDTPQKTAEMWKIQENIFNQVITKSSEMKK